MKRCSRIAAGLVLVLATAPGLAEAHGLGAADADRPVAEYLWLGFEHLLAGWDHLLFILGVVLLAGELWRATKLISLFVLGHSITLMLATTQEWTVSTTFVDVVIALSIVFVAAVALIPGRPQNWRPFGAALLVIGLVHGLGLGTRLLELGVSDDDLAWRILAFNVGVELGQAVAVIAFSAVIYVLTRYAPAVRRAVIEPVFVLIATAGVVGAVVIAVGTGGDEEPETAGANCTQGTADAPPVNDAGHPERKFYDRTETIPQANFDHVLGDGFVVITYRPDLGDTQVAELRQTVEGEDKAVVAGAKPGQTEDLVATTAQRSLTCAELDIPALVEFRDGWFNEIYGASQPTA